MKKHKKTREDTHKTPKFSPATLNIHVLRLLQALQNFQNLKCLGFEKTKKKKKALQAA